MSTPDPTTTDDLARLLLAPGKETQALPQTHPATEADDAAARAFLGLPAVEHSNDEGEG